MNETVITTKIVQKLNEIEWCFAKKKHSGRFQSGDPDIMGCYDGSAFFIETKMITGALTLLQASNLEKWRQACAITALAIYDPKDRILCMAVPNSNEQWSMYVGQESLQSAWRNTTFESEVLSDFDFEKWLDTFR